VPKLPELPPVLMAVQLPLPEDELLELDEDELLLDELLELDELDEDDELLDEELEELLDDELPAQSTVLISSPYIFI
jgi:hypothetical protein